MAGWTRTIRAFATMEIPPRGNPALTDGPVRAPQGPKESDEHGNGWLVGQSSREIAERERRLDEGEFAPDPPDILQLTLEAELGGRPLTATQKIAHMTLLIQAGADTTGSGFGATLRQLVTHPASLAQAQLEIAQADAKGLLSSTVQYDEARAHLPFMCACMQHPRGPAGQPLRSPTSSPVSLRRRGSRSTASSSPAGPRRQWSQSYVVQRDPDVFGADAGEFCPERWLHVPEEKLVRMDAAMYVFGMGPRVCLGKELALMEMHKLVPEVRFRP